MKTRSLVLLLCAALALLLGAWLWWVRRGSSSTALRQAPSAADAEAEPRAELGAIPELPAGEREESHPAAERALESPAPSSPRQAERATPALALPLNGRVIVLDTEGRELAPVDGLLVLDLAIPDADPRARCGLTVPVEAGAWSLAVDARAAAFEVREFRTHGRRTWLERPTSAFSIPAQRHVELHARLQSPRSLRVLDAASRKELQGLEVVLPESFVGATVQHPGRAYAERVLAHGLASPIDLDALLRAPQGEAPAAVLVGAAGYAWRRVNLEDERGGERRLELEPGCELELLITGLDAAQRPWLMQQRDFARDPELATQLQGSQQVLLSGLAPGSAHFVITPGQEWWREPPVLGRASVELVVGERLRVEIACEPAPGIERADAAGRLFVPLEWGVAEPELEARLLGTALDGGIGSARAEVRRVESTRAGCAELRWLLRGLQTGVYELSCAEPAWSDSFELPAGGRSDFVFQIGELARLEVQFVDAVTGAELRDATLYWHADFVDVDGGTLQAALCNALSGRYCVRAPAGRITLECESDEYLPYEEVVELPAGRSERTIRLERACGLRVRLLDGTQPVEIPGELNCRLSPEPGTQATVLSQRVEQRRVFTLSGPGRFAFEPPKLEGFRQPPKQVVDVPAGELVDLDIALERE